MLVYVTIAVLYVNAFLTWKAINALGGERPELPDSVKTKLKQIAALLASKLYELFKSAVLYLWGKLFKSS
jgi:hypothetical protein